jgi:hypothetical protein
VVGIEAFSGSDLPLTVHGHDRGDHLDPVGKPAGSRLLALVTDVVDGLEVVLGGFGEVPQGWQV